MKKETKRILEKARAGDAEAQYLTGLYYEDKENIDKAFLWYERSATQDSYMESTPSPYIT